MRSFCGCVCVYVCVLLCVSIEYFIIDAGRTHSAIPCRWRAENERKGLLVCMLSFFVLLEETLNHCSEIMRAQQFNDEKQTITA